MDYVDRNEDPPIQIVGMHEHITNSAMLLTATSIKRELQRVITHIKDSVAEKTKERW
jgi:hypothetical protein